MSWKWREFRSTDPAIDMLSRSGVLKVFRNQRKKKEAIKERGRKKKGTKNKPSKKKGSKMNENIVLESRFFLPSFTGFDRVWPCFTGFYRVLLGFQQQSAPTRYLSHRWWDSGLKKKQTNENREAVILVKLLAVALTLIIPSQSNNIMKKHEICINRFEIRAQQAKTRKNLNKIQEN